MKTTVAHRAVLSGSFRTKRRGSVFRILSIDPEKTPRDESEPPPLKVRETNRPVLITQAFTDAQGSEV